MSEIENEKDLKMKYIVFKIDDIKQILDITEQKNIWSMLNKIVEFRKSELDEIISRNRVDYISRRICKKSYICAIEKRFPKDYEIITSMMDEHGLGLPDD